MNTKYLFGLLFIGLLVGSCKKELEPQDSSVPATPAVAGQQPNGMAMQQTPAANGQPVALTPQQMQMTQAPQGQPATVAPGMNPAHGQPGHRCDIPVGAPLNSPIKTTAQTGTTTQSMRMTPTPAAGTPAILNANPTAVAPAETKPGMNPPHGQPGHRCDIAVGAPLSSPPGKTTATPTPVKVEPKAESSQFTVSDPAKTEEKKAE